MLEVCVLSKIIWLRCACSLRYYRMKIFNCWMSSIKLSSRPETLTSWNKGNFNDFLNVKIFESTLNQRSVWVLGYKWCGYFSMYKLWFLNEYLCWVWRLDFIDFLSFTMFSVACELCAMASIARRAAESQGGPRVLSSHSEWLFKVIYTEICKFIFIQPNFRMTFLHFTFTTNWEHTSLTS